MAKDKDVFSFAPLHSKPLSKRHRLLLRIGVLVCLVVTAVIVGYESYNTLRRLQREDEQRQFAALTDKIESYTLKALNANQDSLQMIADASLYFCPTHAHWPLCAIPFSFYEKQYNPLQNITDMRSFTQIVRVSPEEVPAFESFAYSFFNESGHAQLGISDFGKGIFSFDPQTKQRVHDTTWMSGGGSYVMLLPVLQATNIDTRNAEAVMFNVYSSPARVQAIDYTMRCIEMRNLSASACSSITSFVTVVQDFPRLRPSSLVMLPIVVTISQNDSDTESSTVVTKRVVGFANAVFSWDTVLTLAASDIVSDVDVVITASATETGTVFETTADTATNSFKGKPNISRRTFASAHSITSFPSSQSYTYRYDPYISS